MFEWIFLMFWNSVEIYPDFENFLQYKKIIFVMNSFFVLNNVYISKFIYNLCVQNLTSVLSHDIYKDVLIQRQGVGIIHCFLHISQQT